MSYRRWLIRASTISLLAWANSSFVDPDFVPNRPLTNQESVRETGTTQTGNSDSLLFILSLSGGGTRSAALSFGALKALRDITIDTPTGPRRALDEIDAIYAVSGGAFTAAYFGLYGDRIFDDFQDTFLRRNLNVDFPPAFARPGVIRKLLRKDVGRSEAMVSYLDSLLFSGHTVDELLDDTGPKVEISASDLASGKPFTFSAEGLGSICTDARSIPVARAITASSAVPVLYSPVRLNNYAAQCANGPVSNDPIISREQKFVHLADGGLTDNTGLRAFLHKVRRHGSIRKMLKNEGATDTRHIVLLYVDASVTPMRHSGLKSTPMSTGEVVNAATATMIQQYSRATLAEVERVLTEWKTEMAGLGKPVKYDLIHLSFDNLAPDQREYFNAIPTNFALSGEHVDKLIHVGASLLHSDAKLRDWVGHHSIMLAESH